MTTPRHLKEIERIVRIRVRKNDPAHDFNHIMRVYKNAKRIARKEKVDTNIVLAAALLHDIVSYPKSDPRSKNSSVESANTAKKILHRYGYKQNEIDVISDAILNHSFSRGKVPETLEGKVLQDADKLDAMGSIGIARVFSVGGAAKRKLYNNEDPFCKKRLPDDSRWTLDHFYKKLLLLEGMMHTKTAKKDARDRIEIMKSFLDQLKEEIYR